LHYVVESHNNHILQVVVIFWSLIRFSLVVVECLNNSCITFLETLFLQKGFSMLSIALEKQKGFVLQKMIGKVGGLFSKIKLDGGSIMAMMGSTSEKMYLCQVPRFGFK
jgi:hypothetical protein